MFIENFFYNVCEFFKLICIFIALILFIGCFFYSCERFHISVYKKAMIEKQLEEGE